MNLDLSRTMQNEDFRKTFGIRLKNLRQQKRWSQKELAAKVDIRFQQLNKYESGLNLPPTEMPLGNARLFKRFKAVEYFDGADQETVISLIDAMIAKQQMQTTLVSLDDQAATG